MHHSHPVLRDPTFAAKARSTWEILRRVARYLRPYKWLATGTIGCALLSLIFALAYPKLTQYVVDDVIGHHRSRKSKATCEKVLKFSVESEAPSQ